MIRGLHDAARIGLTILIVAHAVPALGDNKPSSDLVRRAEKRRALAETDLANGRKTRLEERTDLTRRLQRAYERLATDRADLTASRSERERLEHTLDGLPQTAAKTEADTVRLTRLLRQAAGGALSIAHDLSLKDLTAQIEEAVQGRLQKLESETQLRIEAQDVIGRDGRAVSASVAHLGRAAAVAAGDDPVTSGLVTLTEDGTPRIVGPVFDAQTRDALRRVVRDGSGAIPLDVDGALTRSDIEPAEVRAGWLAAGGFFLWPILLVGALGLVLLAERIAFFALRPITLETVRRVTSHISVRDLAGARAVVSPPRTDLDRVLLAGIEAHGLPREVLEQRLETALLQEEPRLERSLSLLGAVAGLAPLLGLLGTVTGMITTFDVISVFGTGNPRLLSGGISVALITTQVGLIVAIPALLGHAWVSRALARRQGVLEAARTSLLGLPPPADGADP